MSGRDHSIECPKCGLSYGGLNGPDECDCKPGDPMTPDRDAVVRELLHLFLDLRAMQVPSEDDVRHHFMLAYDAGLAAGRAAERAAVVRQLVVNRNAYASDLIEGIKLGDHVPVDTKEGE